MKISTEIGSIAEVVGEEHALALVASAGFDCWDFSMTVMAKYVGGGRVLESDHPLAGPGRLAFARRLRRIGLDFGITCNQSHAPFPVRVPGIRDCLKHSIECTAEAGGKICIIHPDNDKSAEENAEMYLELLPFAREHGVKIATENMWNWDKEKDESSHAACSTPKSFVAHLEAVGDPYLVACLDIGHAEMRGQGTNAVEMIRAIGGSHLQALHIHDNDKWHDSHKTPFTMDIDFPPIVAALHEIGYSGEFTLEACYQLKGLPAELVPEEVGKMALAARRLADMFEAL